MERIKIFSKGGEQMKIRDKERLCNDLIRICDQIGIIPDEIPHLVFDRKRYNEIRKDDGCSRNAVRDSSGECNISAKTIFVDGRKNEYQYVE